MAFRNYIPPDGGHVECGIWQKLALQDDDCLISYSVEQSKRDTKSYQ